MLFLEKELSKSVLYGIKCLYRQRQRLLYWPIILFTIACCIIFKIPLSTSASWLGLTQPEALWVTVPSGVLSVTASWLWLKLSLTSTDKQAFTYIISWCPELPIDPMIVSAYLHRCVSDWWLGQGSICNICQLAYFSIIEAFLICLDVFTYQSNKKSLP